MAKLTLTNITSLQNETSAITDINANSTATEDAIENTLSRDGTSPNQMGASLDMNSNRIINLPSALNNDEPVRLGDYLANASPLVAGNMPAGGTTGQILTKLSDTDFDTNWITTPIDTTSWVIPDLVGDGVTDDQPAWLNFLATGKSYTRSFPRTVTISIASPAIVSLTAHGMRVNEAFVLSTTGSLPTGITAGTIYYVMLEGFTKDSFQFSTFNSFDVTGGAGTEGPAVNTSGTESGTHSLRISGGEWTNILFPPRAYNSVSNLNFAIGGQRKLRIGAYGSTFTNPHFGTYGFGINQIAQAGYSDWGPIAAASQGSTSVTLLPMTFTASITGNTMTVTSCPRTTVLSSNQVISGVGVTPGTKITVPVTGTGVGGTGTYNITPSQTVGSVAMSASNAYKFWVGQWIAIYALDLQNSFDAQTSYPANDHYIEYQKITAINTSTGVISLKGPLQNSYRSTFPLFWPGSGSANYPVAGGPFPSGGGPATIAAMNQNWDIQSEFIGGHSTEAMFQAVANGRDISFIDWHFDGPGATPTMSRRFRAHRCIWGDGAASIAGSGTVEYDKMIEHGEFTECTIDALNVQSSGGHVTFDRCEIGSQGGTCRTHAIKDSLIKDFTIGPQFFGATEALSIENSRILRLDQTGRLDGQYPSPASGLLLAAGYTFTGGTLKQPIATTAANSWAVPGRKCFFNDLKGTYQNMGSPFTVLDVYKDGSDNFCIDTDLPSMPVGNSTSSVVTISTATDLITWNTHGLVNDDCVAFTTTGTLPTGITAKQPYFVINSLTNTFGISASVAGAAIDISGSQSGVHTAIGKPLHIQPHPCPRVTVKSCVGCETINDLNGAVDEPLFSRMHRYYTGVINSTTPAISLFVPAPKLWGNLISLTVTVHKVYSGAINPLTMTITGNGFDSSLIASNLSQVIDLKTLGTRVITPTAATGSVGVDVIAAYPGWLSDTFNIVYSANLSGGADTIATAPLVEVKVLTDQGITKFDSIIYMGPTQSHPEVRYDTGVKTPQE